MSDYISRDELKEVLLRRGFYPVFVKTALESLPAIDIVRCKDCKHAIKSCARKGSYMCRRTDDFHIPEYYCYYGERRDGDDTR